MLRQLILFIFLAVVVHSQAEAAEPRPFGDRLCSYAGEGSSDPQAILAKRSQFDCGNDKLQKATDYLWLVADIADLQVGLVDPVIRYRAARHGPLTVHAVHENGDIQTTRYSHADLVKRWRSPYAASLPVAEKDGSQPVSVLIGVQDPWEASNWMDIDIVDAKTDLALANDARELSALLLGLLFAPLLLDLVFFLAVRQRFIVYHMVMISAMIVTEIVWTGQIFSIWPSASFVDRSVIGFLSLSIAAAGSMLLVRELLDPKKLGLWGSRLMLWTSAGFVVVTAIVMIFAADLPVIGSVIFHIACGLTLLVGLVNILNCARQGDRIAMMQLLGFSGILVISVARILRSLGFAAAAPIADNGFFICLLFEIAVTCIIVSKRTMQMRRQRDLAIAESVALERLAMTDPLTRLLNRNGFHQKYDTIMQQAEPKQAAWFMLVLDIDFFKRTNDRFGHDGGDVALRQLSDLLQNFIRKGDICARFGGEEFVMLAVAKDNEAAAAYAERLRRTVESFTFGNDTHPIGRLTISIGVVPLIFGKDNSFHYHFEIADRALYRAKAMGRNQMMFSEQLVDQEPDDVLRAA